MPIQIGTKKVLPNPSEIKKQKRAEAREKEKKKEALYKRRKESEALLFGSELLEPIAKKEKEVIIHFPETHTDEGIFISKCGKFGYRATNNHFYFDLFYFINPIVEFEASLVIIPSDENWLFDNLTPEELEDIACKLRRAEYAEEKRKALQEIRELERQRREELDRADAEFEAQQEKEAEQLELQIEIDMVPEKQIEMLPLEPTLEEMSAIEAKMIESPIKPKVQKPALVPLIFKKVDKI